MNTYKKYCPNVYIALCDEKHNKGDIINVTTRRGDDNESIVYNYLGEYQNKYMYSITRADGFNTQERAKRKVEKYSKYAGNAATRAENYIEASKEGSDFLKLYEPIKVGHHSESRHRNLIKRNQNRMNKAVENYDKAQDYEGKKEYWEKQTKKIDLSMPESIEYYEYKLEKATKYHADMKSGKIPKQHSYSLTYAKKDCNEFKKKLELAKKLWG